MTFIITVYGTDHDELDDFRKGELACHIHDVLQEDYSLDVDSVGIEGYGED